jgi:hypothetical protein
MDFASYVKYIMITINLKYRPSLTFEKFNEILDRITIISSFLSIDLKKKIKEKYVKLIRVNNALSSIFRRLKSFKAKWMVRILLKDYSLIRILETAVIHQFYFLLPNLLSIQNSFEIAVKFLNKSTIRYISFRVARDADNISREITNRKFKF